MVRNRSGPSTVPGHDRTGTTGPTGADPIQPDPSVQAVPGGAEEDGPAGAEPGEESHPFIGPEGGRSPTREERRTPITGRRHEKTPRILQVHVVASGPGRAVSAFASF